MRRLASGRSELSVQQLRAIARDVMRRDAITDAADLSEALKCRIVRLGFEYPHPDTLTRVIAEMLRDQPIPMPLPLDEPTSEARPLTDPEVREALAFLATRFKLPQMEPHVMPDTRSDRLTTRQRYALIRAIEDLRAAKRRKT